MLGLRCVKVVLCRFTARGASEYWMGGPSLSLTDTPSGSLSRTGMEFHPHGGAAITASKRDFAGPASPEFTCH